MKKYTTRLLLGIFFLAIGISTNAQFNIHYWDFNSGTSTTAGNKWPSPIAATTTSTVSTITHIFTNTEDFAGSTLDASGFTTPAAGASFSVVDSSNNNKSLILNVPTTGFQNVKLTYATRGTATGFVNHIIDYSIDGVSFTNQTTLTGRNNTTFALQTIDFTTITGANDNPNFKIRITINGSTTATGNNRFDNFRVHGSPLNPNIATVAAGANAIEPATNGSFIINLSSAAPTGGVNVTYSFSGSGVQNTDFTDPQNGSVTIPAGSTSATVIIQTIDDNIPEPTKNITLKLLTASNTFNVSTITATITLYDNDVVPGVNSTIYNFNNCGAFISQGFKEYSVTGAQVWNCTKLGRTYTADPSTDSAIQMNGYFGSPQTNEDWLISPPFDLSAANNPIIRFFSKSQFNGNPLVLKVSTNYVPGTNPNTAIWTNINGKFPAAGSNIWTVSDSISLAAFSVPNVFIAWQYTSTTSIASQWSLDDIKVNMGCTPPTTQPTSLNLTPSIISVNGSFTATVPPSNSYLVLQSISPTLTEQPINGSAYAIDDVIGNATVISINNQTTFVANNLTPSTPYYFYVFAYSSALNCYNIISPLSANVSTLSPPACTPPSTQATNIQGTVTGNSINFNYTRGNGDNVLIIARANLAVSQNPIRGVNYTVGAQIGFGTVIYNGPNNSFLYNSLTQNTTYHFTLFEYTNANFCYNLNPLIGSFTTSCIVPVNVTSLNTVEGNGTINLSWINPNASCFSEVIVVVSNAPIPGSGDTFTGTANTTYAGPNQVVYRSTGSSVTVNGLTNLTTYYFKIFTRNGSSYSSGVVITATPFDPASGFLYLYGNLHSHSSYSDGNKEDLSKKPIDDFKFARDANCMDFLGMSDHNHAGAGMNIANYPLGFNDANTVNLVPGPSGNSLITLWGTEWGVISGGGHVLVYGFNEQLIGWEPGNYNIFCAKNDYASLFNIINSQPGAFGTFAHPGFSDYGNLSNSTYNASADNAIVGTAIESGPAFSTDTTYSNFPSQIPYFDYYRTMLAKGYHIGAQIDGDNHYMTFGKQSPNRMVVLTTSRTRPGLVSAIKDLRFYASNDCNVRLDFKLNSAVMGSNVTAAGKPVINIGVIDPDPLDLVDSLYIYGGKIGDPIQLNPLKKYAGISSVTFDFNDVENIQPDNTTYYYYTLIKQADGNRVISSPIWYSRNDAALPVTLIQIKATYNANEKIALIDWSTAQEKNTRLFNVERSTNDGRTFIKIGTVNAIGTSNQTMNYQFTDPSPVSGSNLYRLQMVDIDGTFQYSPIVKINVTEKNNGIFYSVYPNPAHQFTYVTTNSNKQKELKIQLIDAAGRMIKSVGAKVDSSYPYPLDLSGIVPGIYLIRIIEGNVHSTSKIIIK